MAKQTNLTNLDAPTSLGLPFTTILATDAARAAMGLDGGSGDGIRVHLAFFELTHAVRAAGKYPPIVVAAVENDGIVFTVGIALSRHAWKERPDTATIYSLAELPDPSWSAVRPPSAEEVAAREEAERQAEERRLAEREANRIIHSLNAARAEIEADIPAAILELQQRAGLRDPVDGRRVA